MSKASSLLMPVLAKRRGKNPDKKSWHNLPGSSSSLALYNAAKVATTPILLVTSNTPEALRTEQELRSLAKNDSNNQTSICLFPDWETLPYDNFSPHQDIISERVNSNLMGLKNAFPYFKSQFLTNDSDNANCYENIMKDCNIKSPKMG